MKAVGSGAEVREVQGIPQQRDGSGVEGRIAGVSVGTDIGRGRTGNTRRLRESAADPGEAGATVATAAERVGHRSRISSARAIFVRGHANVRKRLLIHVCGFNLGLLMRHLTGVGTPRSLQGRVLGRPITHFSAQMGHWNGWNRLWERFWRSFRLDSLFWASQIHH